MFFLARLATAQSHLFNEGKRTERLRWSRPVVYDGGFAEVQKLAAFSVPTESMFFEVGACFGFVLVIEEVSVSELLISVSKGTLA